MEGERRKRKKGNKHKKTAQTTPVRPVLIQGYHFQYQSLCLACAFQP